MVRFLVDAHVLADGGKIMVEFFDNFGRFVIDLVILKTNSSGKL